MARRYELPDDAWELLAYLVSCEWKIGRPYSDSRLMLNGILWILCSGAAWRDILERFEPWSTVYQRFRAWREDRIFNQVLERLHLRFNQKGLIDLDTCWMIDSTAIWQLKPLMVLGEKRPEEPVADTVNLSRGGLATKIHMLCDLKGIPLSFVLSLGQSSKPAPC
ncbi:Putative transposase of IS4/5 family [Pseudomonas luteola]|nr:Putative transposase of IS4/5 family [Pseudomonas zeshuii]